MSGLAKFYVLVGLAGTGAYGYASTSGWEHTKREQRFVPKDIMKSPGDIVPFTSGTSATAATEEANNMNFEALGRALLSTFAFSCVGILVFALAFWLMEKVAPFSVRKEIEEDENDALAMIMSAVIIGIALIIMGALLG